MDEDIEMGKSWIREVYEEVMSKTKRNANEGVFPQDFLYEMIPFQNTSEGNVWWMPADHPIALCLIANEESFQALMHLNTPYGNLIAYTQADLKKCRDFIVEKCKEHDLKIKDPNA